MEQGGNKRTLGYALVIFIDDDPVTSFVGRSDRILKGKTDGPNDGYVKWCQKNHRVKILKRSKNLEYLEGLQVTTQGRVYEPETMLPKSAILALKRRLQASAKGVSAAATAVAKAMNDKIMRMDPISDSVFSSAPLLKEKKLGHVQRTLRSQSSNTASVTISKDFPPTKTALPKEKNTTTQKMETTTLASAETASAVSMRHQKKNDATRGTTATGLNASEELTPVIRPLKCKNVIVAGPSSEDFSRCNNSSKEQAELDTNPIKSGIAYEIANDEGTAAANETMNDEGTAGAKPCSSHEFPYISTEVEEFFTKMAAFISNKRREQQNSSSEHSDRRDGDTTKTVAAAAALFSTIGQIRKDDTVVELMKGSGVFLPRIIISDIVRAWRKDPNQMTRKIMRNLISEEELKSMTPYGGTKDRHCIPPHIFTAVEHFVRKNLAPDYRLSRRRPSIDGTERDVDTTKGSETWDRKAYTRCLRNMCTTLRNPRTKRNAVGSPRTKSVKRSYDELRLQDDDVIDDSDNVDRYSRDASIENDTLEYNIDFHSM